MLVGEVLRDYGYTTIEAGDARTGLRVLQSSAPVDLLVTDVGLPGSIDGRQLAERARLARPALKILFITGYAENARLGTLDAGMQVLAKPFALSVLTSRIRDMLTGPTGEGTD
jgi:DNA-binding response OmpR family regulator